VLLPNNRAVRAITDAFVRRAQSGLLLPRLIAIGDPELDDRIGSAFDPADGGDPIPPAIDPLRRRMLLARAVQQARRDSGRPVDAAEAVRLAGELARTLDQLLVEEVAPARLADAVEGDLSRHWQQSLSELRVILDRWPAILAQEGRIDLAEWRNRLLVRAADRWATTPPQSFVIAAGITTAAPAVVRLLRSIARVEGGMVVLPGLDVTMDDASWAALGPHRPDPETDRRRPSIETHPQFQLKQLLDGIGVGHREIRRWRWSGGEPGRRPVSPARAHAIGNAMLPAELTGRWQGLPPYRRRLSGVRAVELATPAEEAQTIAIALREATETPGRTAALVTPDRALASRVSAHLARWGITADDSAGRPLSTMPPGTLLLALAQADAEQFAPVALLGLLKHPLVRAGDARLGWLDGVRRLDRALRGPRPAAGLGGVSRFLAEQDGRDGRTRKAAFEWWSEARPLLAPLEAAFAAQHGRLEDLLAALRDAATILAGDAVWSGPDGRALADLLGGLEDAATVGPADADPQAIGPLLQHLMDTIAVRPPQGGHPRVFIWGLIEARLQSADLLVLGGLNEGTWPALPSPDPWLAPGIRRALGLPGLERRIGLAAHDFAMALGAPQVLITRARRDARAPAVASRFWLRLEAMTGGITRAPRHRRWAQSIDRPDAYLPATRPAPAPPAADRPRRISVTEVDRLKADPFAFYARAMLRLSRWDAVDADASAAWRGSAVHRILEEWMLDGRCAPEDLVPRAERMLADPAAHPLMRALWQPRLIEAVEWIAREVTANLAAGRRPLFAEKEGEIAIAGVALKGIADRIDRLTDGSVAIVDYKTGMPPKAKAVQAGFAMQLGLLGLIAEQGGFGDAMRASAFEYWSLAKRAGADSFGYMRSPVGGRNGVAEADFTRHSAAVFAAAAESWLTGDEPFTAKLHPEYAPYGDYDQLMRLEEWYGRD